MQTHRRKHLGIRLTASMAGLALALTGCQTMPQASGSSNNSAASQYITSCLGGAVVGVAVGSIFEKFGVKQGSESKNRSSDLAKAAVAGCVIGIAATAIGRVLNERQQAKHEEALQKEAQRRALEQQQYEAALQRADKMPAKTAAERKNRDAARERLKTEYEASLKKPVTVDLGEGAASTIAVQSPVAPAPGSGAPAQAQGCRMFAQSVSKPPNGDVRQYDTFCPNGSGQYVRVDSQPNPVG